MKLRIYVDLCVCGATFNSSHSCHAQIKNYVLFTKENCCGLRFVICISGFMYSMCARTSSMHVKSTISPWLQHMLDLTHASVSPWSFGAVATMLARHDR